jgi:hypothetical protein
VLNSKDSHSNSPQDSIPVIRSNSSFRVQHYHQQGGGGGGNPDSSEGENSGLFLGMSEDNNFQKIMPDQTNYTPVARGHLGLVILTEISSLSLITREISHHLAVILHQVFLGFDHSQELVFSHCRILLQNLVQILILDKLQSLSEDRAEAIFLMEFLSSKRGVQIFHREDISVTRTQIPSTDQLCSLVHLLMEVFSKEFPQLRDSWAQEALTWVTSCPDNHWRCRSLQILRALNPDFTQEIFYDLLNALVKWLPSSEPSSPGVVLEILFSLQVMLASLNTSRLVLLNQVFWSCVALLESDFEVIYIRAVTLLSILLDRISFYDKAVQHIFLASRPKTWPIEFLGIQPILLKGLLSIDCEPHVIDLLLKICLLPLPELFHVDVGNRLITAILSVQTWLCTYLPDKQANRKCCYAAGIFAKACEDAKLFSLANVYSNLFKASQSVETFLAHWAKAFAESFFPAFGMFSFVFLLEVLQQGPPAYQKTILWILYSLINSLDVNLAEFNPKIPSWFGLVSQFLQTPESWKEALRCLELVVRQSSISKGNMDLAHANPFRSFRKPSEFLNQVSEGNLRAVRCLEQLLQSSSDSGKSDNIISPRAFMKFFSPEINPNQNLQPTVPPANPDEDFQESDTDDSSEAEDIHGLKPSASANPFFGRFPDIMPWGEPAGLVGFPAFTGLDDILADLQKESETSYSDPLTSFSEPYPDDSSSSTMQ